MSHLGCTSATWRQAKNSKGKRGNQTPGKDKPTCQANPAMRTAARRNRSYKNKRLYTAASNGWKKNNKKAMR